MFRREIFTQTEKLSWFFKQHSCIESQMFALEHLDLKKKPTIWTCYKTRVPRKKQHRKVGKFTVGGDFKRDKNVSLCCLKLQLVL